MNVAHERAFVLRERIDDVAPGVAARIEIPYRTFNAIVQVVFFVLASLGVGALFWLFKEAELPAGVMTAILAIAIAEFLIHVHDWWWTGVESALWLGALFAIIFDLPGEGKPEALLLFAIASGIAGFRVRNPLLGALAAGFVMHYVEQRFDLGVLFALVCGAAALLALLRTWERPSNEWLFVAVALALPLAGYGAADQQWRTATIALYAAYGALALFFALRKKHHAMFLSAVIGFTIASIETGRIIETPLEYKLAAGGAFLLALAFIVTRLLRDRERGFVLTAERVTPVDEWIELAGTIAVAQAPKKNVEPARTEGGGGFGGAGATGSYE